MQLKIMQYKQGERECKRYKLEQFRCKCDERSAASGSVVQTNVAKRDKTSDLGTCASNRFATPVKLPTVKQL